MKFPPITILLAVWIQVISGGRYNVYILTGDDVHAGTVCKVEFEFKGSSGSFDRSEANFWVGKWWSFYRYADIGRVNEISIEVTTDPKTTSGAWFWKKVKNCNDQWKPHYITVTGPEEYAIDRFIVFSWISSGSTIQATKMKTAYEIWTRYTSSKSKVHFGLLGTKGWSYAWISHDDYYNGNYWQALGHHENDVGPVRRIRFKTYYNMYWYCAWIIVKDFTRKTKTKFNVARRIYNSKYEEFSIGRPLIKYRFQVKTGSGRWDYSSYVVAFDITGYISQVGYVTERTSFGPHRRGTTKWFETKLYRLGTIKKIKLSVGESWTPFHIIVTGGGQDVKFTRGANIYKKSHTLTEPRRKIKYRFHVQTGSSSYDHTVSTVRAEVTGSKGVEEMTIGPNQRGTTKHYDRILYDVGTIQKIKLMSSTKWRPIFVKVQKVSGGPVQRFTAGAGKRAYRHTLINPELKRKFRVYIDDCPTLGTGAKGKLKLRLRGRHDGAEITEDYVNIPKPNGLWRHFQGTQEIYFEYFDIKEIAGIDIWLTTSNNDWFRNVDWVIVADKVRSLYYKILLEKIKPINRKISAQRIRLPDSKDSKQILCHYHNFLLSQGIHSGSDRVMHLDLKENYPCNYITYGENIFIRNNKIDLEYTFPQGDQKTIFWTRMPTQKVYLSLKLTRFDFHLGPLIWNIANQLRMYHFDGIEVDTGHLRYTEIGNKTALNNFLKALHGKFLDDSKKGEKRLGIIVVVYSKSTWISNYDINGLKLYADIVVINAIVNEWPNHSPYDLSTISPSSLYTANHGGESQNESIMAWVKAGLPRQKIVMPVSTFAWNTPYCVNKTVKANHIIGNTTVLLCREVYDYSFGKIAYSSSLNIVPYFELCNGKKPYMNTEPYKSMQTGPGVPFENEATVLEKIRYVLKEGLRGTKVVSMQYDDHGNFCRRGRFPLTMYLYRSMRDPFNWRKRTLRVPSKSVISDARPAGLSAVLVLVILWMHIIARL